MGNSSSAEIKNSVENRNINRSLIETVNTNMASIITNTVVSNKSSTLSSSTQVGDIEIGSISAIGKGSDISGLQILIDQNAQITFTANDKSIQDNNIMVDYALKLVQQLQNSISNDQAAKLASDAKASQENGWLSTAASNSVNSNVSNDIKNINENENTTKILNQVTSTIEQNSTTLNFKECIMTNLQSGRLKVGEITAQDGGKLNNITIGIRQTMDIIQTCVFDTLQKSDITTKIAQDFGFTVTNDTANKQSGDSTAAATSKQTNAGLSLASSIVSVVSVALLVILGVIFLILRFSLSKSALKKNMSFDSGSFMDMKAQFSEIEQKVKNDSPV